jgi:acyl-CoA synthetase (AMP-forming)/AMP-acid ligase II
VFATWCNSKAKPTDKHTFQQIWDEAGVIAHDLCINNSLEKGDTVVLCYNFGLQFFSAFLGCLRAGVVAVLVCPPSPKNLSKALPKMTKIIQDSVAKVVLVDETVNLLRLNPLSKSRGPWPQNIRCKVHPMNAKSTLSHQALTSLNEIVQNNPITSEDLAFLQCTSGSTGNTKGVIVAF